MGLYKAVKRCVGQYRVEYAYIGLYMAVQCCIALYRAV